MKSREAHSWFNEDIEFSQKEILLLWLTLEQHGFELCGFTYTWFFFKSIYYSTTKSAVS